jgi:hypothetical protein
MVRTKPAVQTGPDRIPITSFLSLGAFPRFRGSAAGRRPKPLAPYIRSSPWLNCTYGEVWKGLPGLATAAPGGEPMPGASSLASKCKDLRTAAAGGPKPGHDPQKHALGSRPQWLAFRKDDASTRRCDHEPINRIMIQARIQGCIQGRKRRWPVRAGHRRLVRPPHSVFRYSSSAFLSASGSLVPNSWPQRLLPELRSVQSVVVMVALNWVCSTARPTLTLS